MMSFKQALLKGQAPDRGLYMPERIPEIPPQEIQAFSNMEYHEIAKHVANYILEDEISQQDLEEITKDAYNYDIPLIPLYENKYVMRLDQGPTASFKDFAARMMGRLMQHYLKKEGRNLVILTATSGDTGGAVADAFYKLDNIKVIILYPKNEISERQRRQMTTLGENITSLGVDAKFDDCQAMVKEAFADSDLESIPLSSANSINFGRLLPQIVYYFYAYSRIAAPTNQKIIFSVPCGNFGDLMGGILAKNMGLPVEKFVVAVNENDEFETFLKTGSYNKIVPSKACLSSAMNVGHPSNLTRVIDLYGGHMDEKGHLHRAPDMDKLRKDFWAISISDDLTRETIKDTYAKYKFVLEPHGSVGWAGLSAYLKENPSDLPCVSFETADPAKFPEQIQELIGINPEVPQNMKDQEEKEELLHDLANKYQDFKQYLSKTLLS
jgi:threonine synthase